METNRPVEINPSFIEQVASFAKKNQTAVTGFFIVLSLVGIGLLVNSYYKQSYENKAAEELFKAELLNNANESMANSLDGLKKPEEKVNVDVTEVVSKLNKVIEEYPDSTAALQASATLSDLYATKNESQKALEVLEKTIHHNDSNDSVIAQSLRIKMSGYLEKTGNCEKALSTLKPVVDAKSNVLKPEALLRSGLCYETLGQADKAKEAYQKLATEHLDTNQGQQAQKYLKMLGA